QASSLVALRTEQVAQLSTAVMLLDSVIGRLETVEPASVPPTPVAPSPVFEAAVGGLLAFVLAYLGLLLWTILNPRIRNLEQISFLSGMPILAAYPALPKAPRRIPPVPTSFLRAALAPNEDAPKVILLTGVQSRRAVTKLATGLAESFARSGFTTLLSGAADGSNALETRYELSDRGRISAGAPARTDRQGPEVFPV